MYELEVQFSSSNILNQIKCTRKEELIELLSQSHAGVQPNRSRSEREKLAIVASLHEVL